VFILGDAFASSTSKPVRWGDFLVSLHFNYAYPAFLVWRRATTTSLDLSGDTEVTFELRGCVVLCSNSTGHGLLDVLLATPMSSITLV